MLDQLKESFKTFEIRLNGAGKSPWHQLRKKALEIFSTNGLPKAKDEDYRYTQIGRILDKKFEFSDLSMIGKDAVQSKKVLFDDTDAYHVFINNGIVDKASIKSLVPSGFVILTLQDATEKFPSDIEAHFGKYADINKDPFTALNTIFSYEGIFIKFAKNTQVDKPIILHYNDSRLVNQQVFQSRNLIVLESGAKGDIIESYTSDQKEEYFSNHVSEIVIGANAQFNYYKLQNQSEKTYHVDNSFISQYKDSVVKSFVFTIEGKIIRNNLNFALEGQNCETHMFGLYVSHGDGHIDNHTVVDHKVANCFSNEIYKGILDDASKAVFNGKIFVRPDAQKTNAFQSNKNILLTDTASMNSKPQLEIWADDVKCSHGCTTGQLDDEQLFYLRSRGIDKSSARTMLLHAFVDDVLDKIKIDFLHDFVHTEMNNRLD